MVLATQLHIMHSWNAKVKVMKSGWPKVSYRREDRLMSDLPLSNAFQKTIQTKLIETKQYNHNQTIHGRLFPEFRLKSLNRHKSYIDWSCESWLRIAMWKKVYFSDKASVKKQFCCLLENIVSGSLFEHSIMANTPHQM